MVTETRTRGWLPGVVAFAFALVILFVAIFFLTWLDAGDPKIAAQRILSIITMVGLLCIGILIMFLGIMLGQRGDRAMVSHVTGELGNAYRTMPGVIEGESRPVQMGTYRPPAQLSTPRVVSVPRYTVNGVTRPFNAPQVIEVQTQTDDGETLQIPLTLLMRFLACPTPSRQEWTGKREAYSEALQFCEAHGLLDRTANGGARWRGEYPLSSRRDWAMQFESSSGDR